MNQDSSSDGWEFIPLSMFEAPRISASDEVRMWYTDLIDQITKRPASGLSLLEAEKLGQVPPFLLDRLLPNGEHKLVCDELNHTLSQWIVDPKKKSLTPVIIGSIDSSMSQYLREYAKQAGWPILGAPEEESLLTLDFKTYLSFHKLPADKPIVIPKLEKWFLRHHFGLNLLRELVQWLRAEKKTCVIGCQSWAWGYLKKTMKIDTLFPYTLTISPKSSEELSRWLNTPSKPFEKVNFTFRNTVDGQPIFGKGAAADPFVSRLAAHTRGQPRLAREIWRESLLFHDHQIESSQALEASHNDTSISIWVKPWEESDITTLPPDLTNADLRLLHTSLIHGGIRESSLTSIFAANPGEMSNQLTLLEHAGLIHRVENAWQVSTLKYPQIRRKLVQEGFLLDDL